MTNLSKKAKYGYMLSTNVGAVHMIYIIKHSLEIVC